MCLSLRLEALVLIRIVFSEAATEEEAVEDVVSLFFLLLFTKVSLSDNCIEMEDGISRMLQFPVLKKQELLRYFHFQCCQLYIPQCRDFRKFPSFRFFREINF